MGVLEIYLGPLLVTAMKHQHYTGLTSSAMPGLHASVHVGNCEQLIKILFVQVLFV